MQTKNILRLLSIAGALILGTFDVTQTLAASSWAPTLLVNTESFEIIDAGDGTTNIELKFGNTLDARLFYDISNARFNFTKSVFIQGSLTATGSITTKGTLSGQNLIVSGVSSFSGASTFKSNVQVRGNTTTLGTVSGTTLRISNSADVQGPLAVSGAIRTDGNFTLNDDADSNDVTLTFGSDTVSETLKWLNTADKFQFSDDISVVGTISGSALAIDGNATISGSLLVKNNIAAKGTVSGSTIVGFGLGSCNGTTQKLIFNTTTNKFECGTDQNNPSWSNTGALTTSFDKRYVNQHGDTMTGSLIIRSTSGANAVNLNIFGGMSGGFLRVSGSSELRGPLAVTGAIRTDSNITINDDADTNNAVLTFGNNTANQTLTFSNANQRFEFSKDLKVNGSISGSTLTVDGDITLHGVTYSAPSSQGGSNTFLKNDGAGNLTWSNAAVGNGSGGILSLHPEYPNAVYFSSGASLVGQLSASGSVALNENFYHWVTTRATIQDYWISVRVRLPDNFSTWDPVKPIQLRYRTADGTATNNHVTVRMKDTAGALVSLTGGAALANASFTTATISGPEAGGTFAAKGYVTVYIKLAALTAKFAEVGFLNLNYETTTP